MGSQWCVGSQGKEPTGYGEETNQDIKQSKRDWALIYKLLAMEQRGELLATSMLVGFYNSPFGGQRMNGPCYLGDRERREDYSCIRESWA